MGINMKENESEGKTFGKAMEFDKSNFDHKKLPESDGAWDKLQSYVNPDPEKAREEKVREERMKRPSKIEYYLNIAETVSSRSTCLRIKYGSVIVKNDRVISTGYNGSPKGRLNCCDIGECYRKKHNIQHMTRYETCASVHSEMNAIISGSLHEMNGATLYLCGTDVDSGKYVDADCCMMCKRAIINAGITHVVFRNSNGKFHKICTSEWDNNLDY